MQLTVSTITVNAEDFQHAWHQPQETALSSAIESSLHSVIGALQHVDHCWLPVCAGRTQELPKMRWTPRTLLPSGRVSITTSPGSLRPFTSTSWLPISLGLCNICRDNFITGETNFQQDMSSIKGKAEQQGSAQPELRNVAKDIKKVRHMPAPCSTNEKHAHLLILHRLRATCYTHMLQSAVECAGHGR